MAASISQAFDHSTYLTDVGGMQASHSPGCCMLVRAENCVYVAAQALLWGLCEHSFLHRTMCLAKSCWRICGVSSLNHQLVLGDLFLQFTIHTAMCPDISGRVCTEWHIQLQSHCAENYQLPSKQRKVKGQGSCHGRGFTHRCLQNTHCSHRLHMTIYFYHFFITLILLLFGPQA